jgi:hypothetical protein
LAHGAVDDGVCEMAAMADDSARVSTLTAIDGLGLKSQVSRGGWQRDARGHALHDLDEVAGRVVRCEDAREPALNSLCARPP